MAHLLRYCFIFALISGLCGLSQAAPSQYWIESANQKALPGAVPFQSYLNHGAVLSRPGQAPEYSCPAGYAIFDFALYQDSQSKLAGVLFSKQNVIFLEIYDLGRQESLLVKNVTFYQPWKIQFADVDRDRIPEVCLGVFKKSPLHTVAAKRLFIFTFQQGLQPKWLGSKLSRPFRDFAFLTQGSRTILAALEIDQDRHCVLNTYQWDCFGFRHLGTPLCVKVPETTQLCLGYSPQTIPAEPWLFILNHSQISKTFQLKEAFQ